jgi:hypothetical protein
MRSKTCCSYIPCIVVVLQCDMLSGSIFIHKDVIFHHNHIDLLKEFTLRNISQAAYDNLSFPFTI